MNCYACYNKHENLRFDSSSGAAFSALAEKILSEGGIVYGVKMSEDCYSAKFERVDDIIRLDALRGSKYLQAHAGKIYINVKEDLENNKRVLFSGTICQVNALKNYLGKKYEKLICVDVVCHGVPSPKLWRLFLQYMEKKNGKISTVNFRNKKNGWSNYGMSLNQSYYDKATNPYMQMFLRDYCLRPSCYYCIAKKNKQSDLSIADFWGIDSVCKGMNDDKGISLVIIRTNEGQKLFDQIMDQLVIREVNYEEAIRLNPAEYKSANYTDVRERFFADMNAMSFKELAEKYVPKATFKHMKTKMRKYIYIIVSAFRRR